MPKATWERFFALAPMVLLSGCVTYSTYSRPLDEGGPGPTYREGRIESVQEVVRRTVGDPAGGAIAGSLIGALVGQAIGGNGASAFAGAIGGAATGAAVSQGASEQREYVVHVRFDDGTLGRITYSRPPPWRFGDRVRQTAHGLEPIGGAPPLPPQPSQPPPPPPAQLPPPPSGADMDSPP